MLFLKLFVIGTFKDANLAKKIKNLAEFFLKVELCGVHEVHFLQVCHIVDMYLIDWCG